MAERWSEALQTLRVVLSLYSQALARSGMAGSLQDTFRSLSFALGKYSSAVEKRYREDVAIMGVAQGSSSSSSTSYPVAAPRDVSSSSSSTSDEVDSISSSSGSDGVVDYDDSSDYVAAAAAASIGGGELFLAGQLTAPSAEALKFAVSALELIGTHDNMFVLVRL